MNITLRLMPELVAAYMLIFARVGTMMMLLPGLSEKMAPTRVRIGLAFFVSLLVFSLYRSEITPKSVDIPALISLLIVELLIGFTLGLAGRFMIASLQLAGVIVAQQLGLSFTVMVDPANGDHSQSVIFSTFFTMLGVLVIFSAQLHHFALMGIVETYQTLPLGTAPPSGDAVALIVEVARSSFLAGIKLSAPFLVFGLVFNVGLGVLSRMMPQLQVFFLAMPATILLGSIVLMLVLSPMMEAFLHYAQSVFILIFPLK